MHYYAFDIGDYRRDTAHLKPMEHYIYRSLIDWYFLDEKPIPKKTQLVMRRLNLDTQPETESMLLAVLDDFFDEMDDGWHQKRIDQTIADYHAKAVINKENGKKGGRPSKKQPNETQTEPEITQSVNSANPSESELNPNQKPITNNQKPITKVLKNSLSQNDDESEADQPILVDDWMPDFDDIQKNLRELGFKTCDQAKFDLVLAKFKKHNSGKRELESPLDLSLCNWINNERDSKPLTKERKQSPSDQQEPQRTTDTTKTKERKFEDYHDSQVYSGVFTAGVIRKALQPDESPDQCVLRLTKAQFAAKAGA